MLILFLCTANLILGTDTAFDGNLYAVTHADLDGAAFELLYRYAVRHYVYKGAVTIEFNGTFRYGKRFLGTVQYDFCVGRIAGTYLYAVRCGNGSLDFKLVGTVFFHTRRRYVFQCGIERKILQGADC